MLRAVAVAAFVAAAVIVTCDANPVAAGAETVHDGLERAERGAPVKFSFAFAGSAFLVHYYFGVMKVLIDEGVVDPKTAQFGGISGGAVTSMLTCAGATPDTLRDTFGHLLLECRKNPSACNGQFSIKAKASLYDKYLPNTKATLHNCGRGRVRVGLTRLDPISTVFDDATPYAVSKFADVAEMEEALLASSFLSCFVAPYTYTLFRGEPTIDGGYKADFDDICHPGTKCIKVSAYVTGPRVDAHGPPHFSPLCFNASKPQTGALHNWPRFDNPSWLLPTSCAYQYTKFTTPTSPMIFPGKFNNLPYTRKQWESLSSCIGTQADIDNIFNAGVKDAKAFLRTEFPKLLAGTAN